MPFENSTPQPGVECIRCKDRGHKCYAARILDGKALCAFCMDDEPCLYVQREKANAGQVAPIPPLREHSVKPPEPVVEVKEEVMPRGVYQRKPKTTRISRVAIEVKPDVAVLSGDNSLDEAVAFL